MFSGSYAFVISSLTSMIWSASSACLYSPLFKQYCHILSSFSSFCFLTFLHLDEWYTLLYFLSSLSRAASYALCLSLFMCVCCPQYCLSNGMSALHAGTLHLFNGFMLVTPHSVVR